MEYVSIYHGTDVKAINAILRERTLRGDPPLWGPGVCLTLERARSFMCMKAGRQTRRTGRVLEIVVAQSVLKNADPEADHGVFTLTNGNYLPLRELRLDDPRVKAWRVLTVRQQERIMVGGFRFSFGGRY